MDRHTEIDLEEKCPVSAALEITVTPYLRQANERTLFLEDDDWKSIEYPLVCLGQDYLALASHAAEFVLVLEQF